MRNRKSTTEGRGRRHAAAVALALTLAVAGAAQPRAVAAADAEASEALPPDRPAAGRFLVATERIRGSIFYHSVVYLVNYSESGALGLIVNRPSPLELHEVVQGAVAGAGTLYVGGPVDSSMVMMLLRAAEPPERSSHIADDVFLSADADLLLEQTAKSQSDRLRVYAGYAGWTAKQLDGEIARGQWLVVSAPSETIFAEKPDGLWEKLFRQFNRLIARAPPFRRHDGA